MSLKHLSDDQLLSFKKDPIGFLKVEANFNTVFGKNSTEITTLAETVRQSLGQHRDAFAYSIEETK